MSLIRDLQTRSVGKRSGKWRNLSKTTRKEVGHCEACGSKWFLAVHHIIPFHLAPEKELDRENCIVLCGKCHLILGHLRYWKSWNESIKADAAALLKLIRDRP